MNINILEGGVTFFLYIVVANRGSLDCFVLGQKN